MEIFYTVNGYKFSSKYIQASEEIGLHANAMFFPQDFSDWRPSSHKDQPKSRKKGNPEREREQSHSQESPPASERRYGTPRTFPRTKVTSNTPTSQRSALENLRQHMTFSDQEVRCFEVTSYRFTKHINSLQKDKALDLAICKPFVDDNLTHMMPFAFDGVENSVETRKNACYQLFLLIHNVFKLFPP